MAIRRHLHALILKLKSVRGLFGGPPVRRWHPKNRFTGPPWAGELHANTGHAVVSLGLEVTLPSPPARLTTIPVVKWEGGIENAREN
jgi:hypothetical protein